MHLDFERFQRRAWNAVPHWVRLPLHLIIDAGVRWIDVSGPRLGASIAFYTMFALAPLLVVTIAVVGAVFGADAARGQIIGEINGLVGPVAAQAIESMVESAWREPGGLPAAVVGTATLLVGAMGAFVELRGTLNVIGNVAPSPSAIGAFLRVRLTAFALMLGCGFLAIASLLVSSALAALTSFLTSRYTALGVLATVLDFVVSATVLTAAFAALIRWLPDQPPSRKAVWISAVASAILFTVGKTLIGFYLGRAAIASSYGAAGSFVVLMLWVNYSAQILLYGAALGRISDEYDKRRSSENSPM
jgi:membrane protein